MKRRNGRDRRFRLTVSGADPRLARPPDRAQLVDLYRGGVRVGTAVLRLPTPGDTVRVGPGARGLVASVEPGRHPSAYPDDPRPARVHLSPGADGP